MTREHKEMAKASGMRKNRWAWIRGVCMRENWPSIMCRINHRKLREKSRDIK